MLENLLGLGFSTHICTATIDGTIDRMYQQMESNLDLEVAVLAEVRDFRGLDGVCKENYDEVLFDWVTTQAEALHAERMHDLISPFKAISRLFG